MKDRWTRCLAGSLLFAMAAAVAVPGAAADQKIYTGGKGGSYFTVFGPLLQDHLRKSFFNYDVVISAGSGENIQRVVENSSAIGFTQADVLAFTLAQNPPLAEKVTIIRNDVANECLFAVTSTANSGRLGNWGDVQSYARRLRLVTGPEQSGSAVTLRYLQTLNDKLGQATITYMDSTDAALDAVVQGAADVAFFVQFADTSNPRFKKINEAKLHFIPVVDRAMVRERVGDEKVYIPQEVKVTSAGLLSFRSVQKLTTACTPLSYITGNPAALPEGNERRDLQDLIDSVRAANVAQLRPKENWFSAMLDDAVEVSGQGLESLLQRAEDAAKQIRQ